MYTFRNKIYLLNKNKTICTFFTDLDLGTWVRPQASQTDPEVSDNTGDMLRHVASLTDLGSYTADSECQWRKKIRTCSRRFRGNSVTLGPKASPYAVIGENPRSKDDFEVFWAHIEWRDSLIS